MPGACARRRVQYPLGRRIELFRQLHVIFGEGPRLEVEHAAHIVHVLQGSRLGASRGRLSELGTEGLPLLREGFVDGVVIFCDSHDA